MLTILAQALDGDGFVARRHSEGWQDEPGLLWLHLACDGLIGLAYLVIPALILWIAARRLPLRGLFLLFAVFLVLGGVLHFLEVVTAFDPVYRLSALVKLIAAAVSWATVIGLILLLPASSGSTPPASASDGRDELEQRLAERTAELARANEALRQHIAQRDQARAELEAANRTRDEFLATLSHELRTPLTAMLGWVHLLRGGQLDEATHSRGLEVLERNTRVQSMLIDDLLDLSRIVTGTLLIDSRVVDLSAVIASVVEVVRPACEAKGIALEVLVEPGCGPVRGDPTRLRQVVWNLLSNAVKFTPSGGHIEVRLARSDNAVELLVRDDGQGIKAELLPFVFDHFRQGDSTLARRHGGLGLGLALVRHLVEAHGGEVEAHSDGEGRGASLRVRLPVLAVLPEPAVEPLAPLKDRLAGLKVLVIDAEPDACELLRLVLIQSGAEVITAASAGEALAVLESSRPDVLISDLGLPGTDGYSLIRQVRSRPAAGGGQVPAVALTGYARSEDRERAMSAGYQMHATKPIDPQELVAVVRSLAECGPLGNQ
jgi:signal transduction histidine kinase